MSDLDIATADGRSLEVITGGDPDGFGWLFHNGTPTAVIHNPTIEEAARVAGLHLVSYSRPGYGTSTPRPAPGTIANDVADSVTVLDALGIGEFVTLGWSGGGPRALACAALLPDRCRAATTLAGVAPSDADDLEFTAGMAPENVEEFAAAAAGIDAYEVFLSAELPGLAGVTGADIVESMGQLITPVDAAALTGEFADWLAATFRHALGQGVIGWRDDGLALMRPWGFDVAKIRVPVSIWQGGQDVMVPYDHGKWLVAHVPRARSHLYDDEGHLSLAAKFDEILADLNQQSGR